MASFPNACRHTSSSAAHSASCPSSAAAHAADSSVNPAPRADHTANARRSRSNPRSFPPFSPSAVKCTLLCAASMRPTARVRCRRSLGMPSASSGAADSIPAAARALPSTPESPVWGPTGGRPMGSAWGLGGGALATDAATAGVDAGPGAPRTDPSADAGVFCDSALRFLGRKTILRRRESMPGRRGTAEAARSSETEVEHWSAATIMDSVARPGSEATNARSRSVARHLGGEGEGAG